MAKKRHAERRLTKDDWRAMRWLLHLARIVVTHGTGTLLSIFPSAPWRAGRKVDDE